MTVVSRPADEHQPSTTRDGLWSRRRAGELRIEVHTLLEQPRRVRALQPPGQLRRRVRTDRVSAENGGDVQARHGGDDQPACGRIDHQ